VGKVDKVKNLPCPPSAHPMQVSPVSMKGDGWSDVMLSTNQPEKVHLYVDEFPCCTLVLTAKNTRLPGDSSPTYTTSWKVVGMENFLVSRTPGLLG
jgi:hypothetical protein